MKEFFKAGFFRLLFLGFNFLVGLFIAVLSGTELFGTISLMIVNAALIQLVTGFGADQAIVWHGAGKKISTDKLFTFSLLIAIIQIFLFILISFLVFENSGKTLLSKSISSRYYILELIYFSGLVLLEKYISLLYARQSAKTCNLVLSVVTSFFLAILAASWFKIISTKIDPFQFFCLVIIVQAISIIILFHLKTPVYFYLISKKDFISLFRFSGLVFVSNIIQFFAYRTDYWLIDYFKNAEQVGIYSQANRFAGLLWIVPNIIAALLIPKISAPENNFKETDLISITRILNYINLLVTGFVVIVSYFVYTYFLQQEYFKGFMSLLYMLPGFYFFTITIIFAAYFSAQNLLWVNLTGSLICLVLIIIADILFIPVFGINGAAWANTIAYTAATIFTVRMFIKKSRLSFRDLYLLKKIDWLLITKLKS
jgi:O-antigen/teichoic acid export membrane protein